MIIFGGNYWHSGDHIENVVNARRKYQHLLEIGMLLSNYICRGCWLTRHIGDKSAACAHHLRVLSQYHLAEQKNFY